MKIAHLADIQVRFGSRHNEYRTVFKKLIDDLKEIKPDRIVVAGDISHHKINMSPGSFDLISELLINLSRIAPTDVILGNHDMNLQQLEQGDSISPIFNLSNLIQDSSIEYDALFLQLIIDSIKKETEQGNLNESDIKVGQVIIEILKNQNSEDFYNKNRIYAFIKNKTNLSTKDIAISMSRFRVFMSFLKETKIAYVVTEDNKKELDYSQKAIYYYPDSGFYKLADNLVYGVYSMKDKQILMLEKKEPGVKYIALYHGEIFGARGDNGHVINSDNSVKISTFNNFDIVMLGDIHEYQSFREDESMAYCGSLIQQNFGESIDKGYLLWDIENKSHVRKFIPNDFGFAKITIAKGESVAERIEHIKFSSNKKKTKIYVVWEDYEENFSQEKENQIIKLVKDKHGCEIVKVQFETIIKDVVITEEEEEIFKESEQYLKEFIETGDFHCTPEELKDILELHRDTNEKLELTEDIKVSAEWKLNKVEISNIFSFPAKPIIIDFDTLQGITGVFGKNYNGKSNFIKTLVWGLFKEILGGGNPSFITNIYTDSNKGYVKLWITIDGKKYYIERGVKTTRKKDGSTSNAYTISYKALEFEYDEDGNLDNEKWENEKSDEKTAEKPEVGKLIEKAIGTFDDFTKTSLQTQGGKDDYLSMSQQPKNNLVSKYLGLEPYNLRYDFRNEFFKDIKKKQKELGDRPKIEDAIKILEAEREAKNINYQAQVSEKNIAAENKEKTDIEILNLTKKLEKIEPVAISDKKVIDNLIQQHKNDIITKTKESDTLSVWLSNNFKKELPFDSDLSLSQLTEHLEKEREILNKEKKEYLDLESWIKNNPTKIEPSIEGFENDIDVIKKNIMISEGQLLTFRGKKCPTCGTIHEKANPHKEEECVESIKNNNQLLKAKQDKIKEFNDIQSHNLKHKNNIERLSILKQSLLTRKEKMESFKAKIELFNNSQDIIKHNQQVEVNSANLSRIKDRLDYYKKEIEKLDENLLKIINNESKILNNQNIQEQIDAKTELSRTYKIIVFNADKQATALFGEIKVIENNIKTQEQKLIDIKEYEQQYRKYSIYLQAMHRDGIPALIIRKKLPLINHRVNTILQQAVEFKINMDILVNGDIVETFYFNDDKSDTLPLSFASGAQKFVSSIAIKDALHYISSLTKPSLCIIDEGFGTLDDELTFEIMHILNYLKNKHKNVIVITHRNEIKDFADNIIEVSKVKTGLTQEAIDRNPKAGVTHLNII